MMCGMLCTREKVEKTETDITDWIEKEEARLR